MLNAKKMRKACLALVAIAALLVAMVVCLASCSAPVASEIKYKDGSMEKTTYQVGEKIDFTGAVITVTYDDGATTEEIAVTSDMVGSNLTAIASGANNTGDMVIEVVYENLSTTITVKVENEKADQAAAEKEAAEEAAAKAAKELADAKTAALAAMAEVATAEDLADPVLQNMLTAYSAVVDAAVSPDAAAKAAEAYEVAAEAYIKAKADDAKAAADAADAAAKAAKALADAKTAAVEAMLAAVDAAELTDTTLMNMYMTYTNWVGDALTVEEVEDISGLYIAAAQQYVGDKADAAEKAEQEAAADAAAKKELADAKDAALKAMADAVAEEELADTTLQNMLNSYTNMVNAATTPDDAADIADEYVAAATKYLNDKADKAAADEKAAADALAAAEALATAQNDALTAMQNIIAGAGVASDATLLNMYTGYSALLLNATTPEACQDVADAFAVSAGDYIALVEAIVAAEEAAAQALADAKDAALNDMDATYNAAADGSLATLNGNMMLDRYLDQADVALAAAKANVENAGSIAEVNAYVSLFNAEVDALVADQVYAGTMDASSLMERKIALINDIRANLATVTKSPWYTSDEKEITTDAVQNCIERIYLALDISPICDEAYEDALEAIDAAESYLDKIYQKYLLIGQVHYMDLAGGEGSLYLIENAENLYKECIESVTPLYGVDAEDEVQKALDAYVDEETGINVQVWSGPVESALAGEDAADVAYEGLSNRRERFEMLAEAAAVAKFGVALPNNEFIDIDADGIPDNGVTVIDENGVTLVSVIDKITAIGDVVTIDSVDEIQAAYVAYLVWANYYDIVSDVAVTDPAELAGVTDDAKAYYVDANGDPIVIYATVDGNDKGGDNADFGNTYGLVVNYDDLFEKWAEYVTIKDALEKALAGFKAAVDSLGTIMVGVVEGELGSDGLPLEIAPEYRADGVTLVDSNAAITAAEEMLTAILTNVDDLFNVTEHADDYFIVDGVDYRTTLETARNDYNALREFAVNINKKIGRLIYDKYQIKYEDGAALLEIEDDYIKFTELNVELDANGDPVADAHVLFIYQYSWYLECLEQWCKLSSKVDAKNLLTKAYNDNVALAGADTALVDALTAVYELAVSQIEDYEYVSTPIDDYKADGVYGTIYDDDYKGVNVPALEKIVTDAVNAMADLF